MTWEVCVAGDSSGDATRGTAGYAAPSGDAAVVNDRSADVISLILTDFAASSGLGSAKSRNTRLPEQRR